MLPGGEIITWMGDRGCRGHSQPVISRLVWARGPKLADFIDQPLEGCVEFGELSRNVAAVILQRRDNELYHTRGDLFNGRRSRRVRSFIARTADGSANA